MVAPTCNPVPILNASTTASGRPWIGPPGEAYGLLSGLWFDLDSRQGFVYFTTESPPPAGGEDTGNFTPREKALMARARELAGKP